MIIEQRLVLFIEDNDIYRGIVASGPRHHGLTVEVASRGDDGPAMMKRSRPDLVLMDLTMPELTGLGLLGEMQNDRDLAGVPVVVLTAHTGRTMEDEILRRGGEALPGQDGRGAEGHREARE